MIRRNAAAQELFLQHLKNGGLPAASDACQYLDKRLVDKRLNGLNIIRSVDHRIASLTVFSITEITAIFNKFLRFNRKKLLSCWEITRAVHRGKKVEHFCRHIVQQRCSDLLCKVICWDFANFSASAQTHRSSEAYRYRCQCRRRASLS